MTGDPHQGQPVRRFGAPIEQATGAVVLLHGRGGSAGDILSLAQAIDIPQLTYLAPEAAGNSWYPSSFLAPIAQNEPWLTSALAKVQSTVGIAMASGIPLERIAILGFSQGACLASEFVARNSHRYAGLIAFTGGLIGPLDADLTHPGNLRDMPAFFGSGDPDPHVPWRRVQESADIFSEMGAAVELRRYPGRPHTVSAEEVDSARSLLLDVFAGMGR